MNSSRPVPAALRRLLAVVALTALFTTTLTLTTAASASAKRMNLRKGSHGATVRTLEVRLDRLNLLAPSAVDGRYRKATVKAVKKFQRRQHLRPTGRVKAGLWKRLTRAVRAAQAKAKPKPQPRPTTPAPAIIGHRGVVIPDVPENTMLAMRRAAPSVKMLEFDLQLTSDRKLVLMHDSGLARTTNCTGSVIGWTLANLRARCRAGGQPIPTFDEVAAYAATTSLKITPEIKNKEVTDSDLARIFAIIDKHGLAGRTILQSFEDPILERVHELRPDLQLLLLSTRPIPVSQAQAVGATTVGIRLEYLTAADVATYRNHGLKTWTYTAIDAPTLDQARRIRVDAVFTNVPAMAKSRYGA